MSFVLKSMYFNTYNVYIDTYSLFMSIEVSTLYFGWQQLSTVHDKGILYALHLVLLIGDREAWTWKFLHAKQMIYD